MYVNAQAIIERQVGGETEILLQVRDRLGEVQRVELPGGNLPTGRSSPKRRHVLHV